MNPYFGEPWPSGCCDEPESRQAETPVGQPCGWCGVQFDLKDQGLIVPAIGSDGQPLLIGWHKECLLRSTVGSLSGRCSCHGQDDGAWPATAAARRAEALQIWEFYQIGQQR